MLGVIEFMPDGTIIRMNDNFAKVVGYSEQEVIGRRFRAYDIGGVLIV